MFCVAVACTDEMIVTVPRCGADVRQRRARGEEDAAHVHAEDLVPRLDRGVDDVAVALDARRRHEVIESPELVDRAAATAAALVASASIGPNVPTARPPASRINATVSST